MTLLALLIAAQPLQQLPYTPSLDIAAMDKTADPCTDFYQYTCGGWMKQNPIPPDQSSWSVYGKVTDENQQYLWGILEDAAKNGPQKIGDFFASCMDEPAIEKLGAAPLTAELGKIDAVKSKVDLVALLPLLHLSTSGKGLMFGFGSDQDFGDATQVIAFLDAGGLGLPDRDYYFKEDAKSKEIRDKYVQHVAAMLKLVGDEDPVAGAKTVMAMETALAKASLTRVDRRDPYKLFHKLDRKQLQTLTPSLQWNRYLDAVDLSGVKVVNVTEPEFFKALDGMISGETLPHWKTYLRWHLASTRAPYLSRAFVDENFNFYSKTLRGVTELPPRWKRCVRNVDRLLGEALGQEFVKRTFSAKTKEDTLKMTELIETAMQEEIERLDWMTAETKKAALTKLHAVRNKIGYPEKWRDYSSVEVKRGDYFGNVERATVFESRRQLRKIGKPVDKTEWGMTPPTVNAYYNPQMNDVNFPAGVLQPPLYDPKLDDAPNYGNTGSTIGHELTHGFDDEGRQFDAEGNLKNWWSPQDAKAFEERVQCVRDQFAQYTIVDDIKINSRLTSGEDVADLGGTLLAYIAWKKDVAGKELPNADGFTPDQRFFIGFAQWACENQRPENLRVSAITNPHSPGKYRINGIVADLPQFGRAFSCKQGAPMVREKACRVW
ncbi:MAG: M13 family metallopeptidase [Myxococcales bacterium]|nr:M13 family metallopeptidase [Myxococcales bacterium]